MYYWLLFCFDLFLQKLTPTHIHHFEELNYTIKHLEPFSRYTFAVSCKFFDLSGYDSGPSVYTEITSSEEGKISLNVLDLTLILSLESILHFFDQIQ